MNSHYRLGSFSDLIDEFLDDFNTFAPSKLPDIFVSSAFPPCDIIKKEDNSLLYKFAIAGYSDEEVSVDFTNDYLVLKLTPKEETEKVMYRQKGIKKCKAEAKFFVPISHYDVDKVEAKIENGLLSIEIPSKEVAKPKSINIKVK